jgi:hypothetical protein
MSFAPNFMTEQETIKSDELRWLNSQRIAHLAALTGARQITIENGWRPASPSFGVITGLEHLGRLTIHATNGCLAAFQQESGVWFVGHVGHYTGEVKPLYSSAANAKSKGQSKKGPSKAQRTRDFLASI